MIEFLKRYKFILIYCYKKICTGKFDIQDELNTVYKFNLNRKKRGKSILIACFSKSGSTYLKTSLGLITGYKSVGLTDDYDNSEQDISYVKLLEHYEENIITQQHVKGTIANIRNLNKFNIKPIILVRNIFDVIISLNDHLVNESFIGPAAYFTKEIQTMEQGKRLDFIIDLAVQWYISFFVSWTEAKNLKKIDLIFLTYEEVISDKEKALNDILKFYDVPTDKKTINSKLSQIDLTKTRLNKGISGRGETILNDDQKRRIRNYTKHYPNIDFSMIGL